MVVYRPHCVKGGGSNPPSTCTKRWSYIDHKLMKATVEIAYTMSFGEKKIEISDLTIKIDLLGHCDFFIMFNFSQGT